MKLYNSIGPNPHVVRMFMAEKGVTLPTEEVDIRGGVNRQADYLAKNPSGQCPALELDDGTVIAEITTICEYLDETQPGPSLFGETAEERANTRMWTRRIDLGVCEPMANGFRYGEGLKMFESRMRCLPEASAGLKACAQDKLAWLDKQIEGRDYIAGDKVSMADILLFCMVDFFAKVGQPIDAANKNIVAWHERMKARPSAAA